MCWFNRFSDSVDFVFRSGYQNGTCVSCDKSLLDFRKSSDHFSEGGLASDKLVMVWINAVKGDINSTVEHGIWNYTCDGSNLILVVWRYLELHLTGFYGWPTVDYQTNCLYFSSIRRYFFE